MSRPEQHTRSSSRADSTDSTVSQHHHRNSSIDAAAKLKRELSHASSNGHTRSSSFAKGDSQLRHHSSAGTEKSVNGAVKMDNYEGHSPRTSSNGSVSNIKADEHIPAGNKLFVHRSASDCSEALRIVSDYFIRHFKRKEVIEKYAAEKQKQDSEKQKSGEAGEKDQNENPVVVGTQKQIKQAEEDFLDDVYDFHVMLT
ncbi:uncharacterized protein FOMMEDRAFT_159333 [Fomitiporia mediterranea MF3/22]|uniref:uncharacterized protein n=1 Tax=Fomitiporia mediterranea (strain MF3/22) TaxID=694068 RepID=UPI000440740B|nr:uncharacterized protein FOMMEDRAFT_159333 [Fomitiporia mediterranea MF3/22]EJD00587.1 hypothetical protein FOMMEDRAFT_159333 [Fomitiporia mediterranea MF3/22]